MQIGYCTGQSNGFDEPTRTVVHIYINVSKFSAYESLIGDVKNVNYELSLPGSFPFAYKNVSIIHIYC